MLCYPWAFYSDGGLACLQMHPPWLPQSWFMQPQLWQLCCRVTAMLLLPLKLDAAVCMKPDVSCKPEMPDHRVQGWGSLALPSLLGAMGLQQGGIQATPHPTCPALKVAGPAGSKSPPTQAMWVSLSHVLCHGEGNCSALPMH